MYLQVSHMSTRHWGFPENFSVSTQKLIISFLHVSSYMHGDVYLISNSLFMMCDFFWLCEKKGQGGRHSPHIQLLFPVCCMEKALIVTSVLTRSPTPLSEMQHPTVLPLSLPPPHMQYQLKKVKFGFITS